MIIRSPLPDVALPEVPVTPYVFEHAAARSGRPALIDGLTGRQITYGELESAVEHTAAGLAARGYGKGDVFAIYSPNVVEYPIAFHAAARLGAVTATVNPLFTVDELTSQLQDCRARCLFTSGPFLEKAQQAATRAGVREVVVFGEAAGTTPFSQLAAAGRAPEATILPREDLAALPYSSGTTGLPKGVMLTHFNLVANVQQSVGVFDVREGDVLCAVLPFFHIYGLQVIMNMGLRQGATLVVLPRFDLETFLGAIEKHRVTWGFVVPPIALALARHPAVAGRDLSSLRAVLSGAAPFGEGLASEVRSRLRCAVYQGYGLTETSPVTHTNAPRGGAKPGSVGPPIPNTECMVVDVETGAELAAGEPGELCIRGPQVMKGYLGRPDATEAMIRGQWLHTGDIGYADAEGDFFVVDRLKELIKYKGCQVAPAELEALLLTHPAVADVAVIPSPDPEAGEVPKAFVVPRTEVTPDELMAFVAERVAPTKRIRRVEMIDQIPKSPSGKILRRILVDRERAARG